MMKVVNQTISGNFINFEDLRVGETFLDECNNLCIKIDFVDMVPNVCIIYTDKEIGTWSYHSKAKCRPVECEIIIKHFK